VTGFLQRFVNVRREEVASLLASAIFFFFVLTALMVIRPARDALGMRSGLDAIRWLFVGTAVVTLFVNPAFGFLVAKFRRLTFITLTYLFFALSLVGFWALLTLAPEAIGDTSGRVFYVWFSVFNLFSTMVFWALMTDRFSLEQSKRLFGAIAVGGTVGALFGPWLAGNVVGAIGTPALLLVAAGFLGLAVGAAWVVAALQRQQIAEGHEEVGERDSIIGGSAWEGFRGALGSPYLLGISTYVLIMAVIATFIYFTRLQIVASVGSDVDMQTRLFANIDFYTQAATLLLQLFVAGHLMKRIGVPVTLVLLPIFTALGFIGLAVVGSFTAIVLVDAGYRAVQRALTRPARETLFTVLDREDKYKSKAFIDTFVYRGGDLLGAWTEGVLGRLGFALVGLASAAVPLAVVWGVLGLWLGRAQRRHPGAEGSVAGEGAR